MEANQQKQSIHDLLDYSVDLYKDMLIEHFIIWAAKYAVNPKHMQELLLSKSIHNWYFKEYHKAESDFINALKSYPEISFLERRKFYITIISRVYQIYPSALLDLANQKPKGISIYNLN